MQVSDTVDSDSETDFECMFKEKVPEESSFYFKRIDVQFTTEGEEEKEGDKKCVVTYVFNFDNTLELSCTLIIAQDVSAIEPMLLNRMFVSIGLCALPWYWMGFATNRIVIEEEVRSYH